MRGHGLVAEGAAFRADGSRVYWNSVSGTGHAVCACGAMSPVLASAAQRKRWHRHHKDTLSASA
jgi:hypothetical protein